MKKQLEEEMAAEIAANQAMLEEQAKSWEDRYKSSLSKYEELDKAKEAEEAKKAETPHLINVNEDPALSHMVVRFLGAEKVTVGRKDADPAPDIVLGGLSIQKEHAVIHVAADGVVSIEACDKAKIMVGGKQITEKTELHHHDRVMFGASHLYYFVSPKERTAGKEDREQTWESAQEEIARGQGFAPERKSYSNLTQAEQEQMLLQEEIVKVVPMVTEANDIGEELGKPVSFEVKILNKLINGRYKPEVNVLVRNTTTLAEWIWNTKKFTNRSFLIREMYANWVDDPASLAKVPQDEDPFWDPAEPVLVGDATVYLSPLAFMLDFEDTVDLRDYKGESAGVLDVKIDPCNADGSPIDEDEAEMPEEASELIGKDLHYKVQVVQANGVDPRFRKGVLVKFVFFGKQFESKVVSGTSNPAFGFSTVVSFPAATADLIQYLEHDALHFEVWGEQEDKAPTGGAVAVRQRRASIHPAAFEKLMSERDTALNKIMAKLEDLVKAQKLSAADAKEIAGYIDEAKSAGSS
jgi:kinesin family protein 1